MRILVNGICDFAGSTLAMYGDYSDLRKMKAHYPKWDITQSLEETIRQIVEAWKQRPKSPA